MLVADAIFTWKHTLVFIAGSTGMATVGHMVNTFPTPANKYGQWFLGVVKFAVGQRISAMNAFQGNDTMVVAVPQGTASGTGTGSATETVNKKVDVTPDTITTSTEKVVKSETTVPNPNPTDGFKKD